MRIIDSCSDFMTETQVFRRVTKRNMLNAAVFSYYHRPLTLAREGFNELYGYHKEGTILVVKSVQILVFRTEVNISANILTNFVDQSHFWKDNSLSASQEISHIVRKLQFHYRIHNSPQLRYLELDQSTPSRLSYSWRSTLNCLLNLRLCLPSGLFRRSSHQTVFAPFFFLIRATCSAHIVISHPYSRLIQKVSTVSL